MSNQLVNGQLRLTERAQDPATPVTGTGVIFARPDGHLYWINDAGEIYRLSCCDEDGNPDPDPDPGYGYGYGGGDPPPDPTSDDAIHVWVPESATVSNPEFLIDLVGDKNLYIVPEKGYIGTQGGRKALVGYGASVGYHAAKTSGQLPFAAACTLSLWFRFDGTGGPGGTTTAKLLQIGERTVNLKGLTVSTAALEDNAGNDYGELARATWHHLAVVSDGTDLSFVVNGTLLFQVTNSGASTRTLFLGGDSSGNQYFDNIRFYERELSPEEVETLGESRDAVLGPPQLTADYSVSETKMGVAHNADGTFEGWFNPVSGPPSHLRCANNLWVSDYEEAVNSTPLYLYEVDLPAGATISAATVTFNDVSSPRYSGSIRVTLLPVDHGLSSLPSGSSNSDLLAAIASNKAVWPNVTHAINTSISTIPCNITTLLQAAVDDAAYTSEQKLIFAVTPVVADPEDYVYLAITPTASLSVNYTE